ncbi:hypothetical protein SISSUDRAFT_1066874 [Sistotremastrum suecicum HHB10207 ss-3]|uniref:Uncharacterized protein n=1 Tax=Sistotremastrum suecicum HHB10207 ss-3 TaxID=1314776 RepID=A0A165XS88_9AGAM|nr:hypothetical protein SISSUDRAFT_1066874 [Sistotremastrum suecicum HHB10207 ss-3]
MLCYSTIYRIIPRHRVPISTSSPSPAAITILLLALFGAATLHQAISLRMLIEAFVSTGPKNVAKLGGVRYADLYFADAQNPLDVWRNWILLGMLVVGNGFLIYSCFHVWNRSYWISLIPTVLLAGTLVAGTFTIHLLLQTPSPVSRPHASPFVPAPNHQGSGHHGHEFHKRYTWYTVYFVLSFATNVVISFLLVLGGIYLSVPEPEPKFPDARKLYESNCTLATPPSTSYFLSLLRLISASASLYPIATLAVLLLFVLKSNALTIPLTILPQLLALVSTHIITLLYEPQLPTDLEAGIGMSAQKSTIPDAPDLPPTSSSPFYSLRNLPGTLRVPSASIPSDSLVRRPMLPPSFARISQNSVTLHGRPHHYHYVTAKALRSFHPPSPHAG